METLTASVKTKFIAGLDLGQASDYTALSIIESERREVYTKPDQSNRAEIISIQVRHLQRWQIGTAYTTIADELERMFQRRQIRTAELVVDHTGVGRGVVDLLRTKKDTPALKQLHAVSITGGDTVSRDGRNWRVPKRDLVGCVQVLLEQGRLKVAPALSNARILETELQNFKVKIDPATAHDSYSAWRESIHDDLVLSVALACWYASIKRREVNSAWTTGWS